MLSGESREGGLHLGFPVRWTSRTDEGVNVIDAAFRELVASCEALLETAKRNLTIARALADGYRSGLHPPEVVLDAYEAAFERDTAQLAALRDRVTALQSAPDLVAPSPMPADRQT